MRLGSSLGNKLESVVNTLVPAVCKNLASSNQQVGDTMYFITGILRSTLCSVDHNSALPSRIKLQASMERVQTQGCGI